MKILHMADIHANDRDLAEIEKCLRFIVARAREEKPDLIVNAGDTFNSSEVKLDSKAAKLVFDVFAQLANIAPVVVIGGTPSHDGAAAEALRYIGGRYPIKAVFRQPEQLVLCETSPGKLVFDISPTGPVKGDIALITAIPAPTKEHLEQLITDDIRGTDNAVAQAMGAMFAGFGARAADYECPHIVIGHWNVTGALVSPTQTLTGVDIEVSKDQMALANADLVCLGHIHHAQQIGGRIFFSGSTQNNTWGEMSPKGIYFHELMAIPEDNTPGPRLTSDFVETPTRKMLRIDHDFTIDGGYADLDISLYTYSREELTGAMVRFDAKVFADEYEKIDRAGIKGFYESAGADSVDLQIVRVPRENVRSRRIIELDRLRDKVEERAAIKEETVPKSILAKADLLETTAPDRLIAQAAGLPN